MSMSCFVCKHLSANEICIIKYQKSKRNGENGYILSIASLLVAILGSFFNLGEKKNSCWLCETVSHLTQDQLYWDCIYIHIYTYIYIYIYVCMYVYIYIYISTMNRP